ncbi:hypothetical protein ALC56_06627 [Trachymyrmex septentrionalis]|uniref:Mos1 transposase HTH domain-containing protein n=1 Tax=Trachymyrmex septentrionalis TaxID=34720 RepID=A0A151JWR8_9HYME|nr:hypothetical protein ALC56_06627 [Trachymyrmex septentrionalis]
MIKQAYPDVALARSGVFRWHQAFLEGREEVADEDRAGRPSTSTAIGPPRRDNEPCVPPGGSAPGTCAVAGEYRAYRKDPGRESREYERASPAGGSRNEDLQAVTVRQVLQFVKSPVSESGRRNIIAVIVYARGIVMR